MMHSHFFHWHGRVDLKPDAAVLAPRWSAAAEFAKSVTSADIYALLRMVLFREPEPIFAKRFSEKLVLLEPTFPIDRNGEILRVMAAAALYSQMESSTLNADAIALGLRAAAYPPNRVQPICAEVMQRSAEYLTAECERMRPQIAVEHHFNSLEKARSSSDWLANPEAVNLLGDAVIELGGSIGQLSEENQFLWWLVGRRSSVLDSSRANIDAKSYTLFAAAEAADRVTLLPPPPSVEFLIIEALGQCAEGSETPEVLIKLFDVGHLEKLEVPNIKASFQDLTPISSMLAIKRSAEKLDAKALQPLRMAAKFKASPREVACQYFRELMFFKAIELI